MWEFGRGCTGHGGKIRCSQVSWFRTSWLHQLTPCQSPIWPHQTKATSKEMVMGDCYMLGGSQFGTPTPTQLQSQGPFMLENLPELWKFISPARRLLTNPIHQELATTSPTWSTRQSLSMYSLYVPQAWILLFCVLKSYQCIHFIVRVHCLQIEWKQDLSFAL